MDINYTEVIENVKEEIRKKIEYEEKRLKDINDALSKLKTYTTPKQYYKEDVIKSALQMQKDLEDTISDLQMQIRSLEKSISEIEQLASTSASIKTIVDSLKKEIDDRNKKITDCEKQIKDIKDTFTILLGLQIKCPFCNTVSDKQDYKYTNLLKNLNIEEDVFYTNNKTCSICGGAKIITLERLIELTR